MSLPNFFDNRLPSLWNRLLPGRMRRKQSLTTPVTSIILRSSNKKTDSQPREVYRSLSEITTDLNPTSPTVIRKSGERKYRTSFTSTPNLSSNYHYSRHHRRNFSQNPRLNNNCLKNDLEAESSILTVPQQQAIAKDGEQKKKEKKNSEKKKKRNIFVRLINRKDKRTTRSEQNNCTAAKKEEGRSASNLTQIKQPHLRSNILNSCTVEGIKSSNYNKQHIGPPRRFMSDMNLYVPKSVKNFSTSAALEGQFIDESFSFLSDENILMISGSHHRVSNGEFMLSQKSYSSGFTSEFSLPNANYSPQQNLNHFYDNNFHSVRISSSQDSGTSYEEVENDSDAAELAVLRQQLNLRKAGLSKPNLHVKNSFRTQGLGLKTSGSRDKDVLY